MGLGPVARGRATAVFTGASMSKIGDPAGGGELQQTTLRWGIRFPLFGLLTYGAYLGVVASDVGAEGRRRDPFAGGYVRQQEFCSVVRSQSLTVVPARQLPPGLPRCH